MHILHVTVGLNRVVNATKTYGKLNLKYNERERSFQISISDPFTKQCSFIMRENACAKSYIQFDGSTSVKDTLEWLGMEKCIVLRYILPCILCSMDELNIIIQKVAPFLIPFGCEIQASMRTFDFSLDDMMHLGIITHGFFGSRPV